MSIQKQLFGRLTDGREVYRYTLQNENLMTVSILDLGGILQQIIVPDRNGLMSDVVCGFDSLAGYLLDTSSQGALVGRFANRIANASFVLDGVEYPISKNRGMHHIHGGFSGFNRKLWDAAVTDGDEPSIQLRYISPDGEEGFPGNLDVTVTYTLQKNNTLSVHYRATTDKKTVVHLTNHSYFNLGGFGSGPILDHELWMDADVYLVADADLIPTGEIKGVEGTPFDFRSAKPIGKDIDADDAQIKVMNGYDTCYCFVGGGRKAPVLRAVAYDPKSGREMRVSTTQPCVQLYTANGMNKKHNPFKGGVMQIPRTAFCLETGGMPDSVNHAHFVSPVLAVGEVYDQTTEFSFAIRE